MYKIIKGEKHIYLLMAYTLAKQNKKGVAVIGNDNGMVGGYHFQRIFTVKKYIHGEACIEKTLLIETKNSKGGADFSRVFEVCGGDETHMHTFRDYYNEANENCAAKWTH